MKPGDILSDLHRKSALRSVGLMTGTSMDGLDICVADISLQTESVDFDIIFFSTIPFKNEIRNRIAEALDGTTPLICSLNYDLGKWIAEMVRAVLVENDITGVDLIGCHGQTVHHISKHSTLQIGEPSFLAEELGVPVISDFRARDISVGGTGAPLMPRVDEWLFRDKSKARIILNLGGVANVTLLPPRAHGEILGFDTGPGMALLDEVYCYHFKRGFDREGELALSGTVQYSLVDAWLKDNFIQRDPPKSTGRDVFGKQWIKDHQREIDELVISDQLAALSYFTAASIHCNCIPFVRNYDIESIIVSGGGAHHTAVMNQLRELFSPMQVQTTADFGLDVDCKEALGFAILAAAYIKGIPGNLPSVTGADHPVILGKLTV